MTHRGPFQPLPFCDYVIFWEEPKKENINQKRWQLRCVCCPSTGQDKQWGREYKLCWHKIITA